MFLLRAIRFRDDAAGAFIADKIPAHSKNSSARCRRALRGPKNISALQPDPNPHRPAERPPTKKASTGIGRQSDLLQTTNNQQPKPSNL